MSFIVAVVGIGLWVILGKKLNGTLGQKIWYVRPAMLLIASTSLANTFIGIWSAKAIGGGLGWVGGLVHASGAVLAGGIGLLLLIGTALDLKDKRPDGIAKTGLILLPILALVATGPLAAGGAGLFDSINQASVHGLGSLIGS